MRSVAIIYVFAIAIKAAAANDCEMIVNQFDEKADACYESCYESGIQREGLVQIAEVHRRNKKKDADAGA